MMEPFVSEMRLGDVIDDFCIKCRRLTNHSIVSIVDGKAAKVRCRTCYNDHDYRFEQAPPSKKELKKAELFKEVLGTGPGGADPPAGDAADAVAAAAAPAPAETAAADPPPVPTPAPAPAKKAKGKAKKA